MKRYISAILVLSLFMQFFGCTSLREISLEELPDSENVIITTKDSTKYHLKERLSVNDLLKDTGVYFSNDWTIQPDTKMIIIKTQRSYKKGEESRNPEEMVIRKGTATINYVDISNISIEKTDIGKTALMLVTVIVSLVGLILLVYSIAPNPHRI